ncbi:DUF6545 domain-containing protein [Streptomyces sp. NPDC003011]
MTPHARAPWALASTAFAALCSGRQASMGLYVERLYTTNGRQLREHPWAPKDGELPVTCLSIAGTDHVFYPRDTSQPHQQHIVLREMAARALRWAGPDTADSARAHPLNQLLPDLPEGLMEAAVPQLSGPPDETAVEHLATLMGYAITPQMPRPGRALAALEPLRAALDGGSGRAIAATTGNAYLYRQVIDINDAMWRLRQHLSAPVREQARASACRAGFAGDEAAAVAAAIEWRAALRARQRGQVETQVLPLPAGGADFAEEVSRLAALAQAFHGVRAPRRAEPAPGRAPYARAELASAARLRH